MQFKSNISFGATASPDPPRHIIEGEGDSHSYPPTLILNEQELCFIFNRDVKST